MLRSILETIPIFSKMADADITSLSNYAYTQILPKNTSVVRQGDNGNALYVLISGKARVYIRDCEGKEITLRIMQAGEYFGELSLLDNSTRSASVDTLEMCNLAVIPSSEFRRFLEKNPSMALNLSVELSRRLRQCTETMEHAAIDQLSGKQKSVDKLV